MTTASSPFYLRFAFILIIVLILGYVCFIGQDIISPILISLLFAILLRPVAAFMQNRLRFPNVLASLITVLLFMLFLVAILYFISTQVASMADDWDKIKENLIMHYKNLQTYVGEHFNISKPEQDKMIQKARADSMQSGKQMMSNTLSSFTDILLSMVLLPIYMFLMLIYRTHFTQFLCKLVDEKFHAKLYDILQTIKGSVQSYILGLLFELVIVSTLTSVGLLIIGVKYAILLGVITGLLNLIPYIGIMIAGGLSIIASLTGTSDVSVVLGILIVNVVVQFIDNNILVPMVVSSKVEINSIASIIGIVIAGAIAGVSGMFLAIPVMAILKVIFDRVDGLEPWGYLLGDDRPKDFQWKAAVRKVERAIAPKTAKK